MLPNEGWEIHRWEFHSCACMRPPRPCYLISRAAQGGEGVCALFKHTADKHRLVLRVQIHQIGPKRTKQAHKGGIITMVIHTEDGKHTITCARTHTHAMQHLVGHTFTHKSHTWGDEKFNHSHGAWHTVLYSYTQINPVERDYELFASKNLITIHI